MSIRDYFDSILETADDFEAFEDAQFELWAMLDDDDFDLEAWATERGIDLTATVDCLGSPITEWTLWCWDMEGD